MTLSEYTFLKQQLIDSSGSCARFDEVLSTLKELFKHDINSPRTYEGICTIGQLIKVLEIRDVLSEENVKPMKVIARHLNDSELLTKILDYEVEIKPKPVYNQYAKPYHEVTLKHHQPTYSNMNSNNSYSLMSEKKNERIMNTLCEEIGQYWRDLARYLKIRECDIEDIENQNPKLFDKAAQLMKIYDKKKADPQRWFIDLCDALEKSRRKDLSKSIQEIMVMNI